MQTRSSATYGIKWATRTIRTGHWINISSSFRAGSRVTVPMVPDFHAVIMGRLRQAVAAVNRWRVRSALNKPERVGSVVAALGAALP